MEAFWSADRTWDVPLLSSDRGLVCADLKVRPPKSYRQPNVQMTELQDAQLKASARSVSICALCNDSTVHLEAFQNRAGFLSQETVCRRSETDVPVLNLLCGKREGSAGGWGWGHVLREPIAAVTFTDWPPFTGCWHGCYIKEMPPTAAPDNLKHWHCWGKGGKRHSATCQLLFASLGARDISCAEAVWNLQLSHSPSLFHQEFTLEQIAHADSADSVKASSSFLVLCFAALWDF